MRIVYLHQYFNPPSKNGSVRSFTIAKRLVEAGHEVHIVSAWRDTTPFRVQNECIEGIFVHWVRSPYSNQMGYARRIFAFLQFAVRSMFVARAVRADIVYATSTPLTTIIPAAYASFGRKVPIIFEVRDLWPEVPIALGVLQGRLLQWSARSLERFAYWKASHIVALSSGMKKGIEAGGTKSEKISVIPNFAEIELFDKTADVDVQQFRASHSWLGHRQLVSYCGTFGRVNGLAYMVRLAAAMRPLDSSVVFLAVGDGAEKESVIALARQLEVFEHNFFVLDPVSKGDLPVIVKASAVVTSWVIPVRELENNSANKVFDAFAAGVPIAINHGGWQQDLIEKSGAGIVLNSSSPELAAQELKAFLGDRNEIRKARAESRRLGAVEFSARRLSGEVLKIVEKQLSGRNRPIRIIGKQ